MWNGFKSEEFVFEERNAIIVYPDTVPNGKILLKTEYFDAFVTFDVAMLHRGYHLIFIQHRSRWANDEEIDIMAEFVRYCAKKLECDERCVLEGMSCGGLQAARMAEEYPQLCAVMYLDAPVMNLLSMAGLGACSDDNVENFRREIIASFDVPSSQIVNLRKSAIDKMEPLIENNIPIIMLYGNADKVVIFEENGKVLQDFYKAHGGNLKVIARSACEHHPHGLDDPSIIIDFIEKNI